jgi:hypothetical protein
MLEYRIELGETETLLSNPAATSTSKTSPDDTLNIAMKYFSRAQSAVVQRINKRWYRITQKLCA